MILFQIIFFSRLDPFPGRPAAKSAGMVPLPKASCRMRQHQPIFYFFLKNPDQDLVDLVNIHEGLTFLLFSVVTNLCPFTLNTYLFCQIYNKSHSQFCNLRFRQPQFCSLFEHSGHSGDRRGSMTVASVSTGYETKNMAAALGAVKDAGGTIVSENQGVRAVIKEPLMVFAIHSVILHSLFAWDCFCLISSRREIIIRCAWGDPAPCMDSVK